MSEIGEEHRLKGEKNEVWYVDMRKCFLNIERDEMNIEKKAFLDEFDKIISQNRSKKASNLQKQMGYFDMKDLFERFTI